MKPKCITTLAFSALALSSPLSIAAQTASTPPATSAAQPAPMPKAASKDGIQYVVGGVGVAEQEAMKKLATQYNTQLMFAAAPAGNFVVDVHVRVADSSGKTRLELPQAGPMLYAQMPPGTYDVYASYKGKEQRRRINVGAGAPAREGFSW